MKKKEDYSPFFLFIWRTLEKRTGFPVLALLRAASSMRTTIRLFSSELKS